MPSMGKRDEAIYSHQKHSNYVHILKNNVIVTTVRNPKMSGNQITIDHIKGKHYANDLLKAISTAVTLLGVLR